MNDQVLAAIITGVLGLLTGTVGFYFVNQYLEKKKQDISTKREQLQFVFAPLEILLKMNKREFERYTKQDTTEEDKEYIEQKVWHPNNTEAKRIIMEKSHLLKEIPEQLLRSVNSHKCLATRIRIGLRQESSSAPCIRRPERIWIPERSGQLCFFKSRRIKERTEQV